MKWLIQVSKTSIHDCSMLERKLCLYFPPSTLVVTISNWYTEREYIFHEAPNKSCTTERFDLQRSWNGHNPLHRLLETLQQILWPTATTVIPSLGSHWNDISAVCAIDHTLSHNDKHDFPALYTVLVRLLLVWLSWHVAARRRRHQRIPPY